MRKRINISLPEDTAERLLQYAEDNHLEGYSAAINDLVWKAKVSKGGIKGQQSLNDIKNK